MVRRLGRRFTLLFFLSLFVCGLRAATVTINYSRDGLRDIALLGKSWRVSKLIFKSDAAVSPSQLRLITGLDEHRIMGARDIKNACFYLAQHGRFRDICINVSDGRYGKVVIVQVRAEWLFAQLLLSGVWFGKDRIRRHYLISSGELFDYEKHVQSIKQLYRNYHKKGYLHVHIADTLIRDLKHKAMSVRLYICKGQRCTIKSINISGKLPDAWLEALRLYARRNLLHRAYRSAQIRRVKAHMRRLFARWGYPFAVISAKRAVDRGAVILTIRSSVTKSQQLALHGNTHFTGEQLITYAMRDDAILEVLSVPLIVQQIEKWYKEHGFAGVKVSIRRTQQWHIDIVEGNIGAVDHVALLGPVTDSDKKLFNDPLTRQAQHGKKTHALFGRTIVTGMPQVDTLRLLSENACTEGEPWDARALEKTFQRLKDLGVFSDIRIRPGTANDVDGRTPVIIHAVADDPFEIQARVGGLIGNRARSSTYIIGGTVLCKNPTAHADMAKIEINATNIYRDIVAGYYYPGLGGFPLRLSAEIFDKKFDHLSYGSNRFPLYKASEFGGRFGLIHRQDVWNTGCMFTFSGQKIMHICKNYAQAICFEPRLIGVRELYVFLEPYASAVNVDDKLDPRCGFASALKTTVALPLRERAVSFVRVFFEQTAYVPCGRHVVIGLRAAYGNIFVKNIRCLLPSQRFYLGGPASVRSYQAEAVDPSVCYNSGSGQCWVPQGSTGMALLSGELRCSLTSDFSVAAFQDVGFLKNVLCKKWCVASATGFGLRYATRIGPIRFDISWKAHQSRVDQSPFAWFLTIGHAF